MEENFKYEKSQYITWWEKMLAQIDKISHERITNLLENSIQLLTASAETKKLRTVRANLSNVINNISRVMLLLERRETTEDEKAYVLLQFARKLAVSEKAKIDELIKGKRKGGLVKDNLNSIKILLCEVERLMKR
jgi:tRNA uridine 5-carbamoylmethylation protein Kti12